MSDYERAQEQQVHGQRVREACFVALREANMPLSAMEVRQAIMPNVGRDVERTDGSVHRYLDYGEVFLALNRLLKAGAVESQKIHTSRIWWARG